MSQILSEIISDLDARPDYLKRVQTNNVINSLRKHDWVYRWEQVLEKLGLSSTREMAVRQTRLKVLASDLESTLPTQISQAVPIAKDPTGLRPVGSDGCWLSRR